MLTNFDEYSIISPDGWNKLGRKVMIMKSTGIVRKVDDLGRIVLPIELRKILGIEPKDSLEIFVDGNTIMLRKYEPQCVFCGNAENIKSFHEKNVCSECIKSLSENLK